MGRPLKFNSAGALKRAIKKYFAECEKSGEPLTITGLCIALDTTRETLMDYENKRHLSADDDLAKEFSDTIKKAKLKIENAYEKGLRGANPSGVIFALKNFGWTDKVEIDANVNANVSLEERLREMEGDEY